MKNPTETGFYWIEINGMWQVAFYDERRKIAPWTVLGESFRLENWEFDNIDYRKIIRNKESS